MISQVFLSYRHEDSGHVARVRWLAEELRRHGLNVAFDAFLLERSPAGPNEKWSRWCINQAKESACVLIVGSPGWYTAFSNPQTGPADGGFGAAAEAHVVYEQLYQSKWITSRHRIVVLDPADLDGLPLELSGWRVFSPRPDSADLADLIRWTSDLVVAPPADGRVSSWFQAPPPLEWPVADHSGARTAFAALLTASSTGRCLLLKGSSETGKSHITWQMLKNALRISHLACGRFDFKGTTDIDAMLRSFVQDLDVTPPATGLALNERLGRILDDLKKRAQPTLLVFDTYEAAGLARDWVERQLLPSIVRSAWLRVVIAGQSVPERIGTVWESEAFPLLELQPPAPEEWLAFGQPHKPQLTLAFVRDAYQYCNGKASVLAQLLGPS